LIFHVQTAQKTCAPRTETTIRKETMSQQETADAEVFRLGNTPVEVAVYLRDVKREALRRFELLTEQIAAGERPSLEVISPILAAAGARMSDVEAHVARHFVKGAS